MSSIPISGLNLDTTVESNDFIAIVNSSSLTTYRATIQSVGDWFNDSGSVSSSFSSISASYSSFSAVSYLASQSLYSISASFASQSISSSFLNGNHTGSTFGTSSWASNAISASYSKNSTSASYSQTSSYASLSSQSLNSISTSWAPFPISSSYASVATSASYASVATSASYAGTASVLIANTNLYTSFDFPYSNTVNSNFPYYSSIQFLIPNNINTIQVLAWGSGGGGGSINSGNQPGFAYGGGGGGGGFFRKFVSVSPNTPITMSISVGKGGAGGGVFNFGSCNTYPPGTNGQSSSISIIYNNVTSTYIALGGAGGAGPCGGGTTGSIPVGGSGGGTIGTVDFSGIGQSGFLGTFGFQSSAGGGAFPNYSINSTGSNVVSPGVGGAATVAGSPGLIRIVF